MLSLFLLSKTYITSKWDNTLHFNFTQNLNILGLIKYNNNNLINVFVNSYQKNNIDIEIYIDIKNANNKTKALKIGFFKYSSISTHLSNDWISLIIGGTLIITIIIVYLSYSGYKFYNSIPLPDLEEVKATNEAFGYNLGGQGRSSDSTMKYYGKSVA